jgi:hypothetical protein
MSRSRALLVAALLALTAFAACSSDDGGDGAESTADTADADATTTTTTGDESVDDEDADGQATGDEAFCDQLEGSVEGEELDIDTREGMEAFDEFVDAAPAELAEPMATMAETLEGLGEVDEDDPDAFGEVFAAFLDPVFLDSVEEIEAWGVENCDLPEGFMEAAGGGDGDDSFDGGGDGPTSSEVREHIEATYGDESPYADISTWSTFNDDLTVGFGVDATADDALAVCEAIAEYVYDVSGYDSTAIAVTDAQGATLVERDGPDATCESV